MLLFYIYFTPKHSTRNTVNTELEGTANETDLATIYY